MPLSAEYLWLLNRKIWACSEKGVCAGSRDQWFPLWLLIAPGFVKLTKLQGLYSRLLYSPSECTEESYCKCSQKKKKKKQK